MFEESYRIKIFHPNFFYRVSQLCHNIQSLTIEIGDVISNVLADLISTQNNLKSVTLQADYMVAKFCPNLQILSAILLYNEIDTLKVILNSCQYLESIKVWCGYGHLSEKDLLEAIATHSPKNFYELKLDYDNMPPELLLKDLETFLISWNNRIPKRSLSLSFIRDYVEQVIDDESMKLIEKYKKLGIIKKFKIEGYDIRDYICNWLF